MSTEERTKILDKAKKLKELADRGIDGEKVNAKVMLDKYMSKHDITINEITGHTLNGSIYANMTDEQFYKEILSDLIFAGLDFLFSKMVNNELKFSRAKSIEQLTDKYSKAINERINKHK